MTDAPCKGCTDRFAGCHASCERYKEWQTLHSNELDAEKKARIGDRTANSYAINMIRKIQKEQRRRRR